MKIMSCRASSALTQRSKVAPQSQHAERLYPSGPGGGTAATATALGPHPSCTLMNFCSCLYTPFTTRPPGRCAINRLTATRGPEAINWKIFITAEMPSVAHHQASINIDGLTGHVIGVGGREEGDEST